MRLFGGTPPGSPFVGKSTGQRGPRLLSDGDLDGWLDAASKRNPPRKTDRDTLRAYLEAKNSRKWRALQRLLRWAEGEMLNLGLNPEDTRWLL